MSFNFSDIPDDHPIAISYANLVSDQFMSVNNKLRLLKIFERHNDSITKNPDEALKRIEQFCYSKGALQLGGIAELCENLNKEPSDIVFGMVYQISKVRPFITNNDKTDYFLLTEDYVEFIQREGNLETILEKSLEPILIRDPEWLCWLTFNENDASLIPDLLESGCDYVVTALGLGHMLHDDFEDDLGFFVFKGEEIVKASFRPTVLDSCANPHFRSNSQDGFCGRTRPLNYGFYKSKDGKLYGELLEKDRVGAPEVVVKAKHCSFDKIIKLGKVSR